VSEEIDSAIKEKEDHLVPLRSRMEELKEQFIKETCRFAAEWYRKTAKQYIAKYPEVTLGMSEAKIGKMKNEINSIVKSTDMSVRDMLDTPVLWWHMNPGLQTSITQYRQVADKYPEALDRAVRQVLGVLGVILQEYKFNVTASGNSGTYQEYWFAQAPGSKATTPCYPHLLSWSIDMQVTLKEYNSLYIEAMALYSEMQHLKDEKRRKEALNRWDSI
jgi:hypothetical protein